jgi:hypothetical protein
MDAKRSIRLAEVELGEDTRSLGVCLRRMRLVAA